MTQIDITYMAELNSTTHLDTENDDLTHHRRQNFLIQDTQKNTQIKKSKHVRNFATKTRLIKERVLFTFESDVEH